jgi:hypothetical protein
MLCKRIVIDCLVRKSYKKRRKGRSKMHIETENCFKMCMYRLAEEKREDADNVKQDAG